jgi:hypothetical protein
MNFNQQNRTPPQRQDLGTTVGQMIHTYTDLKMAVHGYKAGKRVMDAGGTMEDAAKAALTAAAAWMGFFCYTLCYPVFISGLLAQPVMYYDTIGHYNQGHSAGYLWAVMIFVGIPALILQGAVWLSLYSRVKDITQYKDTGKLNEWGHKVRTARFFPKVGWVIQALFGILAAWPVYILLNNF